MSVLDRPTSRRGGSLLRTAGRSRLATVCVAALLVAGAGLLWRHLSPEVPVGPPPLWPEPVYELDAVANDATTSRSAYSLRLPRRSPGTSGLAFYCIEEVHGSPSVQAEESAILRELIRGGHARRVLVEAPPDTRLGAAHRRFTEPNALAVVADVMLDAGLLDGVSHAWLGADFEFVGVDDDVERAYRRDVVIPAALEDRRALLQREFRARIERYEDLLEEFCFEAAQVPAEPCFSQAVPMSLLDWDRFASAVEAWIGPLRDGRPRLTSAWQALSDEAARARRIDDRLDASLADVQAALARADRAMVDSAVEALEDSGEHVGVLVVGALHTPGVLAALGDGGHAWVLLTPKATAEAWRAARLNRGSQARTHFERCGLRPIPSLAVREEELELQALYALRVIADGLAVGRPPPSGLEVGGSGATPSAPMPLPGFAAVLPDAFAVDLSIGGRVVRGLVHAPPRGDTRTGLSIGEHVLDFVPSSSPVPRLTSAVSGADATALYAERLCDLTAAALDGPLGLVALSLFKVPGAGMRALALESSGEVRELEPAKTERLVELMRDYSAKRTTPNPSLVKELTDAIRDVLPPALGAERRRPYWILRADSKELELQALAALPVLRESVSLVLAVSPEWGGPPASVSTVARKLSEAPGYRFDPQGRIANVVFLLNTPPGRSDDRRDWEEVAAELAELVVPGNVLLNATRSKTLDAIGHAAGMGDGVLVQVVHGRQEGALELASGELISARDLESSAGIALWHTAVGTCRFGKIDGGGLVRSHLARSDGLLSVTPSNVSEVGALEWVRALIDRFRAEEYDEVPPLRLPEAMLKPGGGEPDDLPPALLIGIPSSFPGTSRPGARDSLRTPVTHDRARAA